jgi:hypothetical protein
VHVCKRSWPTFTVVHILLTARMRAGCIPERWRDTSIFGGAKCDARRLLALPASDGTVHVTTSARESAPLESVTVLNAAAHLDAAVMCLSAAFSPSGDQLAVVTSGGRILGFDTRTWRPCFELEAGCAAMDASWVSNVRVCWSSKL